MGNNQLLGSKVIIQEEEPKLRSAPNLPTAVCGFLGVTQKGPIGVATQVFSYGEYFAIFGGHIANSDMAACVDAFFNNGGTELWVTRTVHYTDASTPSTKASVKATISILDRHATTPVATLKIDGKYDGTYANGLKVLIEAATNGSATAFNLTLKTGTGITLETFPNLVIGTANESDANYVETVINNPVTGSKYIEATDMASATASPLNLPVAALSAAMATGDDGLTGLVDADFVGSEAGKTGLRSFDLVDNLTLLAVPGRATTAVHSAMISYCEVTRDGQVFSILDPVANSTAAAVRTYVTSTASLKNLSECGLFYWPRWKVSNPSKAVYGAADKITVPLSGHICGMYSRVDSRRVGGVYDVPAGPDFGKLFGLLEPETTEALDPAKNDLLFPDRINRVTSATGVPPYLDGARTLKESGNWPWVNQRRGVSHIEQVAKKLMDIYRHKGRDEDLLAEEYRTLNQFLLDQCALGAFISKKPSEAFFLDMGGGLNPRTTPNVTKARIGVATKAPNEFIILSFSEDKSIGTT